MKAIVHIGGEKTGTTTIQEFFKTNRDALAQRGILYSSALGASQHIKLTTYALDDDNFEDDMRKFLGIKTQWDLEQFRHQLERDFRDELQNHKDADLVVLSSELLQSRLTKISEMERLRLFLTSFFTEAKILIYLRRQDRVAVSHYSTRLKSDSELEDRVFPAVPDDSALPRYFDYNAILNDFEEIFGIENIQVRLLERELLKDGDLISDFLYCCGIDHSEELIAVERANESLSASAIAFYRRFNRSVPRFVGQGLNPLRTGLNPVMAKAFSGRGPEVAAADAASFYEKFVDGNRQIALRYFPGREPELFSSDFSMYKDHASQTVDPDALIDIATHLWVERSIEIERLKLENYLLRFIAGFRKQPRHIPSPPNLTITPHTPGNLAAHWIGAMLFLGENRKAAEAAAILMEGPKVMPAYMVARLYALLRLGDGERLAQTLSSAIVGPKIAASFKALQASGAEKLKGQAMMAEFKIGDPICQQAYKRLFEWIDLI